MFPFECFGYSVNFDFRIDVIDPVPESRFVVRILGKGGKHLTELGKFNLKADQATSGVWQKGWIKFWEWPEGEDGLNIEVR